MIDFVLGLVMLTAFALVAGAFVYWRKTGETKQPALMVILAVVAVMNVLIWTVPDKDGASPVEQAGAEAEG